MEEVKYFSKKAKQTVDKLLNSDVDIDKKHLYKLIECGSKDLLKEYLSIVFHSSFEDVIYLALKEVARDQRYSCIDAFIKSTYDPNQTESRSISAIQNAQIKGE